MITAIVGFPNCLTIGNGKTYYMTLILHLEQKRDKIIISNYKLNFPSKYQLDINKILSLKNCCIGLDEISSSGFGLYDMINSDKKKRFLTFLQQSRKRENDIYFTSQTFQEMHKGLRRLVQQTILMKKIHIDRKDTCLKDRCEKDHYFQAHYIEKNKIFKIIESEKIFQLYNSSEIIEFEKFVR